MLSFTSRRTLTGDLTNNDSSANLTLMDTLMNQIEREVLSSADWDFLETSESISTVASQQFYALANNVDKTKLVTVTISSTIYTPREIASRREWDLLNQSTNVTSDIPEFFFIFDGQIGFYPKPSSSTSNAITHYYRRGVKDLSIADYTTGNVSVATNGDETLTGDSTSWTTPMAGRWLKITATDTAGQSGDNFWYEVSSITSGTALELVKPYQGVTISGTTAYILGEMSLLPEAYQIMPVYSAVEMYYSSVMPDATKAQLYGNRYRELEQRLRRDHLNKTLSPVIDDGRGISTTNPNLRTSSIG